MTMAKNKYDFSVALLSKSEHMENNNNKHDMLFHPMDIESVKVVKKSRLPMVVAWVCIGCAVIFAVAAVIVLVMVTKVPGKAVPHNTTVSTHSTSTATSPTVSQTVSTISVTISPVTAPENRTIPSSPSSTSSSPLSSTTTTSTPSTPEVTTSLNTTVTTSTISEATTVSITTVITTPKPVCGPQQYQCSDGSCISSLFVCDGVPNCPGGEEEQPDCTCSEEQFQCSSGQCVPKDRRCDGTTHCDDLSDEMNCSNCEGFECDSGLCMWTKAVRCNEVVDCPDLSDEINGFCNYLRSRPRAAFDKCANGMYVSWNKWCDGVDDCYDNTDEMDCAAECAPSERPCGDGRCIMYDWWCDGHVDCQDRSDETDCGICEDSTQFQCSDYTCVSKDAVCDGVMDCATGSDENNCMELKDGNDLTGSVGVLLVQSGGEQLPVCSESWSQSAGDAVCRLLGHEGLSQNTSVTVSAAGLSGSASFLQLNTTEDSAMPLLNSMYRKSLCARSEVISLSCKPKVCGERKVEFLTPFMVGGDEAAAGEWPWVASLSLLGKDICGGVLLDSQWVLTAAHCVIIGSTNYSAVPYNFEVMLGSTTRSREPDSNRHRVPVDKIILHPDMERLVTGVTDWDFALMHLKDPVVYSDYVQPVCLPSTGEVFPTKSQCYIAGWGYINSDQMSVTELREGKMRLWDDDDCRKNTVSGEDFVNINSTMCAGYHSGLISACQGDSGGPLMCETGGETGTVHWSLAGIMSSGSQGCDGRQANKANRFARVSSVVDWLDQVTGSAN